jgi:chaperone required for assembly of F1-ATPase
VMTTLTGSVLIALMHAAGALDADAAWQAAHVDELHQETFWGLDYEAAERRAARRAEFDTASRLLSLVRQTG